MKCCFSFRKSQVKKNSNTVRALWAAEEARHKEVEECTFTPVTNSRGPGFTAERSAGRVKGRGKTVTTGVVESEAEKKTIERLRGAWEMHTNYNSMMERWSTVRNDWKEAVQPIEVPLSNANNGRSISNGRSRVKAKTMQPVRSSPLKQQHNSQSPVPVNQHTEFEADSNQSLLTRGTPEELTPPPAKPLLYVDVNLGKSSGADRIVVYPGDLPETLARNFSTEQGLDAVAEEKLTALLQQQIAKQSGAL